MKNSMFVNHFYQNPDKYIKEAAVMTVKKFIKIYNISTATYYDLMPHKKIDNDYKSKKQRFLEEYESNKAAIIDEFKVKWRSQFIKDHDISYNIFYSVMRIKKEWIRMSKEMSEFNKLVEEIADMFWVWIKNIMRLCNEWFALSEIRKGKMIDGKLQVTDQIKYYF